MSRRFWIGLNNILDPLHHPIPFDEPDYRVGELVSKHAEYAQEVSRFVRDRLNNESLMPHDRQRLVSRYCECHEMIEIVYNNRDRMSLPGKVTDVWRLISMAKRWRNHPEYPLTAIETLDKESGYEAPVLQTVEAPEKKVYMNEIKASIPDEPKDKSVVLTKKGEVYQRYDDRWLCASDPYGDGTMLWSLLLAKGPVLILTNEETDAWLTS